MIVPLRERHLYIWAILAILIPTGFVSAYLAIPKKAFDQIPIAQPDALETVLLSGEDEYFQANYRGSSTGEKQMEVVIKLPLTVPSALVYISSNTGKFNPESDILLGKLESKGVYRFHVPSEKIQSENFRVVFYDFIKKESFHSLEIR